MFLNAGDLLADTRVLERIVEFLLRRPGIDLLFGGTLLHLPTGRQVYRAPRAPLRWLRFGLPAYHQATVVRRAVHLAAPFDLDLRISADYGAIATMMRRGARARRLDQPFVTRDCGPDNLSERETGTRFRDFVRVQREILQRAWPGIAVSLGRLAVVHMGYRMLSRQAAMPLRPILHWPLSIAHRIILSSKDSALADDAKAIIQLICGAGQNFTRQVWIYFRF